jgi:hypothetical protein
MRHVSQDALVYRQRFALDYGAGVLTILQRRSMSVTNLRPTRERFSIIKIMETS